MKTLHVLVAAVFITGAGSALAEGGADGQSDSAWLMQPGTPQNTMGQVPAPRSYASTPAPAPGSASAPAPAAGSDEKPSNAPRATSDSDEVMLP